MAVFDQKWQVGTKQDVTSIATIFRPQTIVGGMQKTSTLITRFIPAHDLHSRTHCANAFIVFVFHCKSNIFASWEVCKLRKMEQYSIVST